MEEDARRERMALLGSLLADIVHEMKTPLAAMRSSADTLENAIARFEQWIGAQAQDPGKGDLLGIVREALRTHRVAYARLEELTRSLRTFSRVDEKTWESASVNSILETALAITAHALKNRITVVKNFAADSEIECHPNQLGQVFINLLMNAAQAIEGPGEIRIKTWVNGDKVWISVADTGPGMSPETKQRLFEAGFTTKAADVGTGLGLSIALRIVQDHQGSIRVDSEPGMGTTFAVELPILQTERKQNGED